jgi:dienelactone hydrolase
MKPALWSRMALLVFLSWSAASAAQVHKESVSFNSLAGGSGQAAAAIPAELYVPTKRSEPFGALVLVHGSSGVLDYREHWYAREFAARGYAALVIDSFKPRGVTSTNDDQTRVTTAQMVQDTYGALAFLATDKRIDSARIGLMGFSKGGFVTLRSAAKPVADGIAAAGGLMQRFAFHIAFYPSCTLQQRSTATTGGPILMMLGERDDYVRPEICVGYARRLQAAGVKAEYRLMPGAHHAWEVESGPHILERAERSLLCEYLIEDDWRLTHLSQPSV